MDTAAILEECHAISAIYSGQQDRVHTTQGDDGSVRLSITIMVAGGAPITTLVQMTPLRYPDVLPSIQLKGSGMSSENKDELLAHLKTTLTENHLGGPMLLTLVTEVNAWNYATLSVAAPQHGDGDERESLAQTHFSDCGMEDISDTTKFGGNRNKSAVDEIATEDVMKGLATVSLNEGRVEDPHVCVLSLQHMRNRSSYLKTIERWATQLNLTTRVMFVAKLILVLLLGDRDDIKRYIQQNRTEIVDVDSKGRGCKERLLTVLHLGCITDAITSSNSPSGEQKTTYAVGKSTRNAEKSISKAGKPTHTIVKTFSIGKSTSTMKNATSSELSKNPMQDFSSFKTLLKNDCKVLEAKNANELEAKLSEDGLGSFFQIIREYM